MFHHVFINILRNTIKDVQFVIRKEFQQCFCIPARQNHKIVYRKVFDQKNSENTYRSLRRLADVSIHMFYYTTHCIKPTPTMTSKCFKGRNDHYNGVTVDSNEESCEPEVFAQRLKVSLQEWIKDKKRTIWFRVHLPHSEWVPILVKEGFKYHHAREGYVSLYLWLVKNEECNVPHYAHTNLGVGAFVYNEKTKEILVIKEKYIHRSPFWKLPGGYVNPGEDIETAVKREVLEETGIQTTFKCLISFRHAHQYAFGCSDIYMILYLSPNNFNIKKCDREISECQWMKLTEYMEHTEVHENNKLIARKMLEFFKHKMGLTVTYGEHPISKEPIAMYTISNIDQAQ